MKPAKPVVKPTKPVLPEQGIMPFEPEPSALEVKASALEVEDITADISLLKASPIASPTHVGDVYVEPQEAMTEATLAVQRIDLRAGLSTLLPQGGLVVPSIKPEAMHATSSSCLASSASASIVETSRRYSGERILGAVMPSIPSRDFKKNIFTFSLKSLLDTIEGG